MLESSHANSVTGIGFLWGYMQTTLMYKDGMCAIVARDT